MVKGRLEGDSWVGTENKVTRTTGCPVFRNWPGGDNIALRQGTH